MFGLPRRHIGKEYAFNAGDAGSIPGSGRFPGRGHVKPLQYSCRENPRDREVWQATVHGVPESDMTEATEHIMNTLVQGLTSYKSITLMRF